MKLRPTPSQPPHGSRPLTRWLAAPLVVAALLSSTGVESAAPSFSCKLPGIATGLWADGQDPRRGDRYTDAQARERLAVLAHATTSVRLYGAVADASAACIAKREFGLDVMLGVNIDADENGNNAEIDAAVNAARLGCVDEIVVGNEVLLTGVRDARYLIEAIRRVKAAVPRRVKVGTAETWERLIAHRSLIEASDIVVAHAHSYWAGLPVESAVAYAAKAYRALRAVAGTRTVILGEVGLPTQGTPRGGSVPGLDNANRFLVEMSTWAGSNRVRFLAFSGFDEQWKSGEPGGVGPHWGIFNSDLSFKAGLEDVFDCVERVAAVPPAPSEDCPLAQLHPQLLTDPDVASCDWEPGWIPTTSGSLCLDGPAHNRSGSSRGFYNYTGANAGVGEAFSYRQQRVEGVPGGMGFEARVYTRAGSLEGGHAFLQLMLEDDAGDPVLGDVVQLDAVDAEHADQDWIPLDIRLPRVPCAASSARVRFGVRKAFSATTQITASFDDAALSVVDRCRADLNGDGAVDFLDSFTALTRLFSTDPLADIDASGRVTFADLRRIRESRTSSCNP